MAESEKRASPTSKGKGKASLLDEDLPKEFLGSWTSALGSDDSSMDFNFESVPKGPTKAFNFDKLDLDFSLDGEFEKIKSFKMDIDDADFSSLPKDSTKANVRSEGDSSKSNQRNDDPFSFSFDFNDLDNFDFDSVLPKGKKKLHKEESSKKLEPSDNLGSDDSRVEVVDDRATVPEPAIGNVSCASKFETSVVRQTIPDCPDNEHVSKSPAQMCHTEPKQSKYFPQRESTLTAQVSDHKGNNIKQFEVDSSDEKSSDGSSNMEAVSSKDIPPKYDREKLPMNNNNILQKEGSLVMSAGEMAEADNADKQKRQLGGSEDCEKSANHDLFVEDPSTNVTSVQRLGSLMAESTLAKEKTIELSSTNFSRHSSILNIDKARGPVQAPARRKLVSFSPNIISSVRSGGRDSVRGNNKVDRITSSKTNTSNLGISSPSKDSTKENVRPGEQSSKSDHRNDGPFSFSFNFNDLDNIASDSALPKREEKLHKEGGGKKIDSLDDLGSDNSRILVVDNEGIVQQPSNGNVDSLDACTKSETSVTHHRIPDYPDNGDIIKSPTQSRQLEPKQSKFVPPREIAVNAQEIDQNGDTRRQMEADSPNEKANDGSSSMQALSNEDVPLSKSDCERFTMKKNMTLEQEVSHIKSAEGTSESKKADVQKNELGSPKDSVRRAKIGSFDEDPSAIVTSVRRLGSLMEQSTSPKGNAQGEIPSAHCSSYKSIMKKDKAGGPVQASLSRRKLVSFHQNPVFSLYSGRSIRTNNKAEGSTVAGNSTSYTHVVDQGGFVSNSNVQTVHAQGTSGSQVHSLVVSKLGSDERRKPKILKPSGVLSVKLPSLKEGKMIPDLSNLKISSMSALEDRKTMRSTKCIELHKATMRGKAVSGVKPPPPNPFLKRISEESASETNPVTFHPAKRRSPSQNSSLQQVSESVTGEEIAYKLQKPVNMPKKPLGSSTVHGSDEQPDSTFELTRKSSTDKDMTSVIKTDERIMKVEACTKQIDEMRNLLRRNQKEAQTLLHRAMINNNRLLVLKQSIHEKKHLHEVQNLAAKLKSKYFPEMAAS